MVQFFTMALVASAFTLAAADSMKLSATADGILAPLVEPVSEPLQAATGLVLEKRTLSDLPTAIISQILPISTRKLCAGAQSADADKLSWALVAELRAILKILNGCLYKVKDCGNAPAPSGVPGGKTPTLDDICQLFFKIMCEIRECCKLIGSLCIKYKAVRRVCQDTLKQITSCLSSIAIRCGVEVGDLSAGLGRLFATIPHFFADVQFGFNAFPSLLGGGYGSFSFDAALL